MRLPNATHTSRPWRIHALARDFRVEDVWALPTPGGPDDFPELVRLMAAFDPEKTSSGAVRLLFAMRWRLGALLGLDRPDTGVGARVPTLRDRLPPDLRDAPAGPRSDDTFHPVYLTGDEWVLEMANQTVHGLLHLGWVQEGGGHRGEMTVLVKANGLLGAAYMAAITPFRHLLVYPLMLRDLERSWRARTGAGASVPA